METRTVATYGPYDVERVDAGGTRFYAIVDGRNGAVEGRTFYWLKNARKMAQALAKRVPCTCLPGQAPHEPGCQLWIED